MIIELPDNFLEEDTIWLNSIGGIGPVVRAEFERQKIPFKMLDCFDMKSLRDKYVNRTISQHFPPQQSRCRSCALK